MKHTLFIIAALGLLALPANAQLKSEAQAPPIRDALVSPDANVVLGFIDLSKIDMQHSFSTSFSTFGGQSMMLNSYVNTLRYQFSDPLSLSLRLGVMNSPYNTLGNNLPALNTTNFFGGADLKYQASENMSFQLSMDKLPFNSYYYSPFRRMTD